MRIGRNVPGTFGQRVDSIADATRGMYILGISKKNWFVTSRRLKNFASEELANAR